jgi:curved DNA-binding protein CbpA
MTKCFEILQISENSNEQQIRKAFRMLSKKYHPDVNGNTPQSVEKFSELNEAYTDALDYVKKSFSLFGIEPTMDSDTLRVAYKKTTSELQNRIDNNDEVAIAELKYLNHHYNVLQASLAHETEEEW